MPEARDLLLEIGTEELPPRTLHTLRDALRDGIVAGLADAGLAHGEVESFATPRRLAVRVRALAAAQPVRRVQRRGPPLKVAFDDSGEPTRAAQAFAEGCGVEVAQLQREAGPKGEWLVCEVSEGGETARRLLPDIVQRALDGLPVARRMRWGRRDGAFVRPVHWIVLLHGTKVVPGTFFGHECGRVTRGHRFMSSGPIELASPDEYEQRLRGDGRVIASFEQRRERIVDGCRALADAHDAEPVWDDALLDEVTALVEWPVPLAGRIDERFLALPPEVLVATLQDHQRYFPLRGADGALLPWFIAVANIESSDPSQVRAGNERVVRPRLADAEFFFAQDRRRPLAERVEGLRQVVFQKALGTQFDKAQRVAATAREVASALGHDDDAVIRAAELAKCDLLTDMVGEFPELQGRIGRYYAGFDGEPEDVAAAIEEQYLPRFAGDRLPATEAGRMLAVADRIDTLAGIFAIGQRPSGTKDPFALRRAALGLLRICIEGELPLDLRALLEAAVSRQPVSGEDGLAGAIHGYVMQRLRGYYAELDEGPTVAAETLEAVLALEPGSPLDAHRRVQALAAFQVREEAQSLAAANKRIANILRKQGGEAAAALAPALLHEPAERALGDALTALRPRLEPLLAQARYEEAMSELAGMRAVVDAFFDQVMVMADDPAVRANRLALLRELRTLFSGVADLSRLPG